MEGKDNFEEEIRVEIQKGFIKQIADKIVQGMKSLDNTTEDVKRRWIWELLQNAKDVPNKFGGVSIIVELFKDKLLFKHNGDCFTIRNLTSLIQQVSSKDDQGSNPNVTGKFGTGFITTHLLSRKFTIHGVAKSQTNCCKRFQMDVDRDAFSSQEMMKKIDSALEKLRSLKNEETVDNYEENRKEDDMDTIFEYPLNNESYKNAEIGVNDLLKVLPYSLLFIPLLKMATILIHNNETKKYIVKRKVEIKGEGIEKIAIERIEETIQGEISQKITKDSLFIMNSSENVNIAWPIKEVDEITKIEKIPLGLPKLFCSFPLIGSEDFFQPMIINSGRFYPNEPRNTIFLRNNTDEVKKNKELLIDANRLFFNLVDYAVNNKFEDFYYLFTNKPIENPFIDIKWITDSCHKPRNDFLLKQKLVKTENGTQDEIRKMFFPKAGNKELRKKLWVLYKKYFKDNIVIEKEIEDWNAVLSNTKYALSIEEFVKTISNFKCLSKMDVFDDDQSRINFLNELIDFIRNAKNDGDVNVSLNAYQIIPNRKGIFASKKELLSDRNNPIPKEIKSIYEEVFKFSLDKKLIHPSIKYSLSQSMNYDSTKALIEINQEIPKIKEVDIKNQVCLMMTELVPMDQDEPTSTRNKILGLLYDLKFDGINKKVLDNLPSDMWRISDPIVFGMILEKLVKFGKSKSPKPVHLLAQTLGKDEDGTMEWLNDYFSFMKELNYNVVFSRPIIPRQDSYFGSLSALYIDEDIPETIKNILSNGNYDIYSELIDKRIKCFPDHKKLDIRKVSDIIYWQLDMKPPAQRGKGRNITLSPQKRPSDVFDVAIKLICLQSESGNEIRTKFFDLMTKIDFYELINGIGKYEMKKESISSSILYDLDKCINEASRFLGCFVIEEMARKENIQSIQNIFLDKYKNDDLIKEWYIDFIHFMNDSGNFRKELLSKNILLNQKGKFINHQHCIINHCHDENLISLSQNSFFKYDYKDIFIDPSIEDALDSLYNGLAKKYESKDIAKFIDDKIKQYDGNKQDPNFVVVIFQIRDLLLKDPENYTPLFPYTSGAMEQLMLNTLSADTLSSIAVIVSKGNSNIFDTLRKFDTTEIDQIQNFLNSDTNATTLNTIQNMSQEDQQYLNENPNAISDYIHYQRIEAQRERERRMQAERERERIRRIREQLLEERRRALEAMRERAARNPAPTIGQHIPPTFHNFREFANMRFNAPEVNQYQPPPPPPKSYEEKLTSAIKNHLVKIFTKVELEEGKHFFECSLIDEEKSEEEGAADDDYAVVPFIENENSISLNQNYIEMATNFPDTFIILIVPNEEDFDESNFNEKAKIIQNIGEDLMGYQIVDTISKVISIDDDNFSFKGCEKYCLEVKENYIKNHSKPLFEWIDSFKDK